jgi:Predicted membrane protein
MNRQEIVRIVFPHTVRTLPADIKLIFVYLSVMCLAILLPGIRDTPIRAALGLPFVLFVPGYLFIAALFPEDTTDDAVDTSQSGIDGIERAALSFGMSIAIVPLIGLVLNFTPFGIRLGPIMVSLLLFCGITGAVATNRRQALPAEEQFSIDFWSYYERGVDELYYPDTKADKILNILLVVSVLLAVGSVGYAVAVPKQGESFTELYLLTEDENGELVADNYPQELTSGEPATLTLGIGNNEHQQTSYTTVVTLQQVTLINESANKTRVRVDSQEQIDTYDVALAHNETQHITHEITADTTGDEQRLTYLLYKDAPPANPTAENAYREVHLWVNVSQPSAPEQSITQPRHPSEQPPREPLTG